MAFRMMERVNADIENTPLKITEFILLKTGWEIFVLETEEKIPTPNLIFTLTHGDELEFGFHDLRDMQDYIDYKTKDLHEVNPPPGWKWVGVH